MGVERESIKPELSLGAVRFNKNDNRGLEEIVLERGHSRVLQSTRHRPRDNYEGELWRRKVSLPARVGLRHVPVESHLRLCNGRGTLEK